MGDKMILKRQSRYFGIKAAFRDKRIEDRGERRMTPSMADFVNVMPARALSLKASKRKDERMMSVAVMIAYDCRPAAGAIEEEIAGVRLGRRRARRLEVAFRTTDPRALAAASAR